jgi:hypothetical protein
MHEGAAYPSHETKRGLRVCCPFCKRWRNYHITTMNDGYVFCVYCDHLIPSNWVLVLQNESDLEKQSQNFVLLVSFIALIVVVLMKAQIL